MQLKTQFKYTTVLVAAALSMTAANAATVNISNAGFEDSFDDWEITSPAVISDDEHTGSQAAKITGSGGKFEQDVEVEANTDYELSAYINGDGKIGVTIDGERTRLTGGGDDEYEKVTVSFNSGSETTITVWGEYEDGTARFDDFTLISEDSSEETDSVEETTTTEITISSAYDDGIGHVDFPASNVIDGDTAWTSRWAAETIDSDANLMLLLDEDTDITEVGIAWGAGELKSHDFQIWTRPSTSDTWTQVYNGTSSGITTDMEFYDITDISAQIIRIKVTANSAGTDWTDITEVKLYGSEASGSTDTDTDDGDSDSSYGNECESSGKILYNGSCEEYSEVFEVESGELGEEDHIISLSPIEMMFDALAAQHVTDNGNGWRHELKIKSSGDYRVGMTEVYEEFKATITATLDDGAKTIVAQHHADTTDTITKLYIADLDESGFENAPDGTESDSVAMNGIFDVYIRLADPDSDDETKHLLTTITSGESFEFEEINDHGVVTITINGQSLDSITVDDSSESYFKFGNYQQAQNPETGEKLASGDADGDWADFFAEYFDVSQITFTEMSYTRTLD